MSYTVNATVDYNVHNNYNVGIWFDFENTGADISHNYIASNWSSGINYEASYNANISYNTLVGTVGHLMALGPQASEVAIAVR